jgi:ATP-dependent Clp protease ATP-binding subunit ClpA
MDEMLRHWAIMGRCTMAARRAVWHARNAVYEYGGAAIKLEHIVLGLMALDVTASSHFAALPDAGRSLRRDIVALLGGDRLPASEPVPMHKAAMRALEAAQAEADAHRGARIQSGHLLVAVLVATEEPVVDLLRARGLSAEGIRQAMAASGPDNEDA